MRFTIALITIVADYIGAGTVESAMETSLPQIIAKLFTECSETRRVHQNKEVNVLRRVRKGIARLLIANKASFHRAGSRRRVAAQGRVRNNGNGHGLDTRYVSL